LINQENPRLMYYSKIFAQQEWKKLNGHEIVKNFSSWGKETWEWKEKPNFLEHAGIRHILGSPKVVEFNGWKEEDTKFVISGYHNGYLWIKYLVEIIGGLIHIIMGILNEGVLI
jgi:hypothetical protein